MLFTIWFQSLKTPSRFPRTERRRRRRKDPLRVERLEDRRMLAVFLTSNGNLEAADPFPIPTTGPPLADVQTVFGGGGKVYTNTIDLDGNGLDVGDEVRSVSIESQASAQGLGGLHTPLTLPDLSTFVTVATLRGTVTGFDAGSGGAIVSFNSGRAFFTSDPLGTFNPNDPSTVPGTGTVFAEYALKPSEDIIATPSGFTLSVPAALVNLSTPDAVNPFLSEAVLLFREDSTDAQNAGATPGSGAGTGGDNFISNVDDVAPAGFTKTDEGVVTVADQTIETLTLASLGLDAADLAVLNAYSTAGTGVVFASGLADGSAAEFDPFGGGVPGPGTFNGDFRSIFSTENHIGHQAEEEAVEPAALGDFVWEDTDGDGIQDDGEPGVEGVTVNLYSDVDGDGVAEPGGDDNGPIATTMTDADGNYLFTGLAPGDYFVEFVNPGGFAGFSPQDQGGDDTVDSDANPATGVAAVTTLVAGETDLTHDAGLVPIVVLAPCEAGHKPATIDFVYSGDGLDGDPNDYDPAGTPQDAGRVIITGDLTPTPGTVRILVSSREQFDHKKANTWFDDVVSLGDSFTADAANGGTDRLAGDTYVHFFAAGGDGDFGTDDDVLLQTAQFHTSCSQPLTTGDAFGGATLTGLTTVKTGGKKLLAESSAAGENGSAFGTLTQSILQQAFGNAIDYWSAAGVHAADLSLLSSTSLGFSDLPGSLLGLAYADNSITIDSDAAGYGWSFGSDLLGGVSLTDSLIHEVGHLIGFDHDDGLSVMAPTLAPLTSASQLVGSELSDAFFDFTANRDNLQTTLNNSFGNESSEDLDDSLAVLFVRTEPIGVSVDDGIWGDRQTDDNWALSTNQDSEDESGLKDDVFGDPLAVDELLSEV